MRGRMFPLGSNGLMFFLIGGCVVADICTLPKKAGLCEDTLPRWYFDGPENRCMPFYYTGCEGNSNRFETRSECETTCPPQVFQGRYSSACTVSRIKTSFNAFEF